MSFYDEAADWLKEILAKARAGWLASRRYARSSRPTHPETREALPPPSVGVTPAPSYPHQPPSQVATAFRRRTGRDPAPPRAPVRQLPTRPGSLQPAIGAPESNIAQFLREGGVRPDVSSTRLPLTTPRAVTPRVVAQQPEPVGVYGLTKGQFSATTPRERLGAWREAFFGAGRPTEDSYRGVGPGAAPVPARDVIQAFETAPERYGPIVGTAIKMAPRIAAAAPMLLLPGGIKPAVGTMLTKGGAFAIAEPIDEYFSKGIDADLDRTTDHLKRAFDIEDTTPDQEAALKAYAGTERESPAYQEYMAEREKRSLGEKFAEALDQVTEPDQTMGERALRNWSFIRHLTPGVLKSVLHGLAAPWEKGVATHVGAALYVAEANQKDSLERQIIEKGVDETKANRARAWLAATGTMPIGYKTEPINKWDYSSIGTGEALEKGEEQYFKMPWWGQIPLIFAGNKWDPLYGVTLVNKVNRAAKYARDMAQRWLRPTGQSVDDVATALKTGEGFLEPKTIKNIRRMGIPGIKGAATLAPEARSALATQETATFYINMRNRAGSGEEAGELFEALWDMDIAELADDAIKVLRSFGLGPRKANAFEAMLDPDNIIKGVTSVNEIASKAALLARAVGRNLLTRGGIGRERSIKRIVDLIDKGADFSAGASRKTRAAAHEELVNLIADSAHSVAGGDPTKLQKFLKPWSKVQGWAARYLHLGLVPGFPVRNFVTDQYVLWSEHGKTVLGDALFVKGKKGTKNVRHTFDEYWGEILEPVRALGFRDFDNLGQATSQPHKWELGYRGSKWAEQMSGKIASAIPLKRQMNQHFHSGSAFEDIFDEITDLAPETIDALRRIMKQASNPRQLKRLFEELRGGTLGTQIVGNHAKPLAENGLLTKVSQILKKTKGNPALLRREVNVLEDALWRRTEPQSVIRGAPFESGTVYEEFHHGTREMLDDLGIGPAESAAFEREVIAAAKQWRRYMDTAVARAYRTIDELPTNIQSQYMQRADEITKAWHGAINAAGTGVLAVGRALREKIKREGGGQKWQEYAYHRRMEKLWQDAMRVREEAFDVLRKDAEAQVGRRVTADAPQRITTVMPDIPITVKKTGVEAVGSLHSLRLPREIRFGKPRYGNRTLTWESDLDMALYTVRSSKSPLSKGDPKYMTWLRTVFPDLSDSEIRTLGESVKDRVKQTAKGTDPYGDLTISPSTRPLFDRPIRTATREMIESGEELGRLSPEFPAEVRGIPEYIPRIETPPMPDDVAAMRVSEAVQTLRNWLDDQLNANLFEEFEGVALGQGKAFIKATRKLLNRHVTGRTHFEAVARNERDYLLHNYGRKYNLDTLLGAAYGYPFWYTRTFAKWAGKTFTNPNAIGASLRFMNSIEDANEEKPIWERASATVENIFGRNEIATNFMSQVIPLALMLEGQYTSANRVKSMFGEIYENMYGNLGPHIAINPIINYVLRKVGREAEASAYAGYMGTTDRTFTSVTSQGALLGLDDLQPGGYHPLQALGPLGQEIYPEMWGRGYDGSTRFYGPLYEHKRMGTELGLMIEEKLISDIVGVDALRVSADSSAFIGEPAMQPAYAAIDVALQRIRTKDFVPNQTSYWLGPRVYIRGEAQLASEEHITALHEEAGELFAKLADPMYPADDLRAEFREFQAKNPDHVVMSGFRKYGEERIRAYNFTVLSRVEPGKRGRDKLKAAGLDYDLVQAFWDNGGRIPSRIDASKFQAGIDALGMILALPLLFEVTEWTEAGTRRGNLIESLQKKYGEEIEELIDDYYNLKDTPRGEDLLTLRPEIKAYLDEEATAIAVDPLMAPYYASYSVVQSAMRATFWDKWEGQLPGSPEAYQYYLEKSNVNKWDSAMRTAYLEQYNLTELNKEYNASMTIKALDERIRAFAAQVIVPPKHARVRKDAPVDTGGVTVQAVKETALESAQPLIRQLESTGAAPRRMTSAVGTAPEPTTEPVTTDPRLLLQTEQTGTVIQDFLDHEQWEKDYLEEEQKKLTYIDHRKKSFDEGWSQWTIDNGVSQSTWALMRDLPVFGTFPISTKGIDGVVAYVRKHGGSGIRDAMMAETTGGNFERDIMAWRVLGTIQNIPAEQLVSLKLQYKELIDIEDVYWSVYGELQPNLGLLMTSMGLDAKISSDGEAYTGKAYGIKALSAEERAEMTEKEAKEAEQKRRDEDIYGSLVVDEDDRFVGTGEMYELIRRVGNEYLEPDIDLQAERYGALYGLGQFAEADAMVEANPNITKYLLLMELYKENFKAGKLIPGSDKWIKFKEEMGAGLKTRGIDDMLKLISEKGLKAVKGLVKDVKKSALPRVRTKQPSRAVSKKASGLLYNFHVGTAKEPSFPADGATRRQRRQAPPEQAPPDLTPWLSIHAKWTQEKNPMLVMLMDYFDLSAYARQAHLQRNPDLARWLATVPAAQLAAIERAYYIWAQQTGRLTPRQERRVSRSRPALASTLRVYKPRGERAGI